MFEGFKGNEKLLDILRSMLNSGRFPHAVMLDGEDGLGKHTVAYEVAKTLLCGNAEYCNSCRACQLFDAGSHPDLITVKPEKGLISVQAVRELKKSVYIKPHIDGGKKVYLIFGADLMNIQAQNAFLKILEEPPEYTVFILTAQSSSRFLDTVISRCTVLKLNPPTIAEAVEVLKSRLPHIDDAVLDAAVRNSGNNIGKALASVGDGELDAATSDCNAVMECVSRHKAYTCLTVLNKYERDREGLKMLVELLDFEVSRCLRQRSLGIEIEYTFSQKELLDIKNELSAVRDMCAKMVQPSLCIAYLCSHLFK